MLQKLRSAICAEGRALLNQYNLLQSLVKQMLISETIAETMVSAEQLKQARLGLLQQHGFYGIAFLLLRAGAYVDALGKDNRTPLHVACRDGGSSVLALLIRNGADMYVVLSILA